MPRFVFPQIIPEFLVFRQSLVKMINKIMPKKEDVEADPIPTAEEKYLSEIVSLLKQQKR
ncbi:hypothetical protein GPK32_11530 [Lactiplantibacillus plantarum]|nr:hypothetical protein GPK32_11530 [Lactiplantibacillus plantarum]